MKISEKTVVKLKYSLSDSKGAVIDSSDVNGSLIYIHGVGMMMPGIEKVVNGQEIGFKFQGIIEPEDGYGAYVQEDVSAVPISQFDHLIDQMEEGKSYNFDIGGGQSKLLKIVKIDEEFVTIDANHPYAGEALGLNCVVEGVREATEDELSSLNSNSGCGCGGHKDGGCHGGSDDHECCGGSNHEKGDDHECCGGHDSEAGGCHSSDKSTKKSGCGCKH